MSGRSIGMAGCFMAGVRIAGDLTYVPAHIKNGVRINARATIPVYRNSHRGTDQKSGEKGRKDTFKLVAWGKLADTCCRSLSRGTAIDVFAEPHSYLGKVYNMNGSLRTDVAGQPIEINKVGFTILNIVFGEESDKTVETEIQNGRRPMHWNVRNHQDWALWTAMLQDRQRKVWDGRSPKFEFARVVVPQGPGIQLDFTQPGRVEGGPGYQQPMTYGQPGNMQQMVAQTLGGQPMQAQPQMPIFPQGQPMQAPVQAFQGGYQQPMAQPTFPQGQPQTQPGFPQNQAPAPQYANPQIPPVGKMLF